MPEIDTRLPLFIIGDDIKRVIFKDQPPSLEPTQLLNILGLASTTPDGKALIERLVGPNPSFITELRAFYPLARMMGLVTKLTEQISKMEVSSNKEQLGQNLMTVGFAQHLRENGICPFSAELLEKILISRPDLACKSLLDLNSIQPDLLRNRNPDWIKIILAVSPGKKII